MTPGTRDVQAPPHPDLLPPQAWVAALSSLDAMGPARLRALLRAHPEPRRAWDVVSSGRAHRSPGVAATMGARAERLALRWAELTASVDVAVHWQRHLDAGVGVVVRGGASFPEVFEDDVDPPEILFHLGDPDVVVGHRVAIIGTRDCTRYGYDLARELGRDLSAAGVSVVSGLALGIDAAAHAGALEAVGAPPIAVVGSGLDVVYPRRNGALWRAVADRGVIWTEYPLGALAVAWHFPARNRLIAALADVVVVVESHAAGGALLTVDEAIHRGRPVMAVPGPVRSPASQGTNAMLADCGPSTVARDVTDVLVALGLAKPGGRRRAAEVRPPPNEVDAAVLEAIGWQPVTLERLLLLCGGTLPDMASSLSRLEDAGWVAERSGWYERVVRPGG